MEIDMALEEARKTFESGETRSYEWRRGQLKALLDLLYKEEDVIFRALEEDLGKHPVEAYLNELGTSIKSTDFMLDNLKKWMAPTMVNIPLCAFPTTGYVLPEPLGVVLIFSAWNYPLGLSLEPLIGALAAGNSVVLKPSELTPATSEFLAKYLPKYLDKRAVKVIQGGPQIAEQLLERKWDKIFFTGSGRVGRIIMTAAAKNLTPVALELGGKCPAIVDSFKSSRDKKVTVERIIGGKWGACSGQVCIGVDYLLVEEKYAPTIVNLLKETLKRLYPKPGYARIVNKHHFQRLTNLLQDPLVAASIVHGGSTDIEKLLIEPTILVDPPLNSELMTEEIFGPLLPIITLKKIEDSIEFIRARPKPLVVYAFTHNEKFKQQIIEQTSSGSVTFNDTLIQYVLDGMPFGGVGQSGFGQYHGKYSFDTFSHGKAILKRSFLTEFSFRYPPWNEQKLLLCKRIYQYDYIGFVLVFLGLKRS